MKKFNKKVLFLTLTILLLIFLYLLKYQLNKDDSNKINQTSSVVKPPLITSEIKTELNINTNNFDKSKFDFPNELPVLSIAYTNINKNSAEEIKNKLGLKSETLEFNDVNEGTKYINSDENHFLVITPNNFTVKYGSSDEKIIDDNKATLKDEDFIKIGESFLINNQFYKKDEIKAYRIEYLKRNEKSEGLEEVGRENAEIFRINFIFNNSQFKIVNNYSKNSTVFIELNREGEIYNSEFKLVSNLTQSAKLFKIKEYDEFINDLSNSKLVSLEGDYYSASDIKNNSDVSDISINSVEIAYFDEGMNKDYLQPIFLINANVTIKNSESNKAILYLPAISNLLK